MQCNTIRPETGSISRTTSSSTTSPFLPNASCSSLTVSGIRRPRRGDKLTLLPLPQQSHRQCPYMPVSYPLIPTAISVAIPTPKSLPNPEIVPQHLQCHRPLYFPMQVQKGPSDNPATLPNMVIEFPEVQAAPDTTHHLGTTGQDAKVAAPSPPTGSHTTAAQTIASPTTPSTFPPIICLSIGLTNLITNVPHSGTPGTTSKSSQQTVLKPKVKSKVLC